MAYTDKDPDLDYSRPDPDTPEHKKDEEWYKRNIRYYTTFYNQRYFLYNTLSYDRSYSDNTDFDILSPVEKGLRFTLYYLAKQKNIDYNYVTSDYQGNTLQAVWVKGKKVKQLIDHLLGNLINQLENKDISAKSLSPDAISRKSKRFDELMLKYDQQGQKIFDELRELGVEFSPAGDREFEDEEDIKRFIEYDWKENSEMLAIDIAKHLEEANDATSMYIREFLDYAAADYCGTYHYVENGKVKQQRIPFYDLIWDYSTEDYFNRDSRFVGFIQRYTPSELFQRWKFTKTEKEEIKRMAENDEGIYNTIGTYNTFNLNWWTKNKDVPTVAVVKMFWKGPRDMRYVQTVDPYGNIRIDKAKKDYKPGEYETIDIHTGILIGNKYLRDEGYANNVVRDKRTMGDPELPIKILTGQTLLGEGVSIIETISQNQDRMDLFRYKIIEKVSKDSGKSYIINGNKLGETIKSKELLQDFKSMGIHVMPGVSGEDEDITNSQKTVEVVDLTLDPSITSYIELYREEERIMEEAMNIPKIALGQQQGYIGLGTQKGTIAQSTLGLANIFRNFTRYNQINLQYSINVAKMVYPEKGNVEAPFVVGDRGIKFLKILKGFRFEDILIYIKTKDIVDEAMRGRLIAMAQALAQNGEIDMLDYLNIETSDNLVKLMNEMEYSIKKRREERAIQAQAQLAASQAAQQEAFQKEAELTGAKEAAHTERTMIEADSRVEAEEIKADAKTPNPTKGQSIKK